MNPELNDPHPMKLEMNNNKNDSKHGREFAEKEVAPLAAELDKTGEYPTKTLEKMAKLGFLVLLSRRNMVALVLIQLAMRQSSRRSHGNAPPQELSPRFITRLLPGRS